MAKTRPKPEKANKGGRPSLYSRDLVETIAARLATGEPMAVICRDEGMPAYRTVKDWMDDKPEVSAIIARARDEGYDAIAAGTLEIADDSRNDYILGLADAGDDQAILARTNGENIQRSKLRIETRLKLLAKWDPRRYGERMTFAGDKDNPLQVRTVADLTDEQLLAIAAAKAPTGG